MVQVGGGSANPYGRSFQGFEVPRDSSRFPELQPDRDLDPSRLKLPGQNLTPLVREVRFVSWF